MVFVNIFSFFLYSIILSGAFNLSGNGVKNAIPLMIILIILSIHKWYIFKSAKSTILCVIFILSSLFVNKIFLKSEFVYPILNGGEIELIKDTVFVKEVNSESLIEINSEINIEEKCGKGFFECVLEEHGSPVKYQLRKSGEKFKVLDVEFTSAIFFLKSDNLRLISNLGVIGNTKSCWESIYKKVDSKIYSSSWCHGIGEISVNKQPMRGWLDYLGFLMYYPYILFLFPFGLFYGGLSLLTVIFGEQIIKILRKIK